MAGRIEFAEVLWRCPSIIHITFGEFMQSVSGYKHGTFAISSIDLYYLLTSLWLGRMMNQYTVFQERNQLPSVNANS